MLVLRFQQHPTLLQSSAGCWYNGLIICAKTDAVSVDLQQ
jgi:hypothetical protein